MDSLLIHRSPSVGSIVKKMIAINPELGTADLIELVRMASEKPQAELGEFSSIEVINEKKAIALAKATLK
jgi:hypothetical protein